MPESSGSYVPGDGSTGGDALADASAVLCDCGGPIPHSPRSPGFCRLPEFYGPFVEGDAMNATTLPHEWDEQGFCRGCGVSRRRVAGDDPHPCPSAVRMVGRNREALSAAITRALLERGPLWLDDNDDAMIAAAVVEAVYPTGATTDMQLVPAP